MADQDGSIGSYNLRTGLTIFPAQDAAFERALSDLVQNMPARFALLTDTSGLLINFQGERDQMDLVALGSLVAGDLAASQAIAAITGEQAEYQLVLRQGRRHNLLLVDAGQQLVLLVQASAEVPLGWSRMLVMETAQQLQSILKMPLEEAIPPAPEVGETNLTDLFGQALDNLWSD